MPYAAHPTIDQRWRSGKYIGQNKPNYRVTVQRGLLDRTYREFTMLDGSVEEFGEIAGSKHVDDPWQAFWRATGPVIDVPNVSSVDVEQSWEDNGVATATIQIENVVAQYIIGAWGAFHLIREGLLAPWFGWATFGRPSWDAQTNEWWEVFNGGYKVTVHEGYGDVLEPTFTGYIDESKVRATPATITLVARDLGQVLTDMRVFGHNKAKELPSPVVFAPRLKADDTEKKGSGATASSSDDGNPPSSVTKNDDAYWLSDGHSTPNVTEWIQVKIPKGRYETVYIYPHYDDMEVYVSIYARNNGLKGKPVTVNGEPVPNGFISRGLGVVPGANGGHPFVKKFPKLNKEGKNYRLGFKLECGDDTVVRISFRRLAYSASKRDYRAGCQRVVMHRRKIKKEALAKKWVLVDDASDIVKWVLLWAGFREWQVEAMGVNIKENMVFHQSDFLIDIINRMKEQGDFIFYIDRPTAHPESLGVPVFRRTRALDPPAPGMLEVRESDLLTGIEATFTKEPLTYIIRTRGRMASKAEGGKALGEDKVTRVMASYLPPWSGAHHNVITGQYDKNYPFSNRLGGLVKHTIHGDNNLVDADECMMANILIAMKQALAAFTAIIEIPGRPDIALGTQVSVIDTSTGMNTRVWVASRQTSNSGEGYKTTVAGSILDTPDILALAFDYFALLEKVKAKHRV